MFFVKNFIENFFKLCYNIINLLRCKNIIGCFLYPQLVKLVIISNFISNFAIASKVFKNTYDNYLELHDMTFPELLLLVIKK